MEKLPRKYLSRDEMMKRVARFNDLKGFDGGLPDSKMPGSIRTLFNVIGFQPPEGHGENATSPVGDDAAKLAAIKISEGFNLGYCKAKPGNGPMSGSPPTPASTWSMVASSCMAAMAICATTRLSGFCAICGCSRSSKAPTRSCG